MDSVQWPLNSEISGSVDQWSSGAHVYVSAQTSNVKASSQPPRFSAFMTLSASWLPHPTHETAVHNELDESRYSFHPSAKTPH